MNTLTSLLPDLYEALDVVSRELVGFIPSVTLDAGPARAAIGEIVRSIATPAATAEDVTPGQLPPDDGDQNIGNVPIQIVKARSVPFRWTGEEQKGVNHGPGYETIRRDQITQAFRTLTNEIEVYCGGLVVGASRASGTAGTTPFQSDLSDPANLRQILSDNGAPLSNLQLVINTAAGAKMRSLAQLTKANEAGTIALREQGILLNISNFDIRESAGVQTSVIGTASGGTITATGAKGATAVTVTTGSGAAVAILAGDVVNFAGDSNKYLAAAACTIGASTTGTLTLTAPGLMTTISAAAVTVGAASVRNAGFSRSAIVLATRKPAMPEEGDMATDVVELTDERSGLVFEVAMYKQYMRVRYECRLAYGGALIKPEHCAILQG